MHVFLNTYSYRPQNFSGRDDVRKKADAFCDELITETSSAGMQTRRVPQLIRKYLPQTAIKRISAKAKGYDNIGGLYRMDIEYNPSRNVYQIKNRVLSLRTPENPDKKSIDKYLCSVAHEVTHGLQSFDNDIRDDKAITEALSDIPMEKWTDMADIAYRIFEKTEKEMLFPMTRAHRDIMYYNSATPFCTRTNREKNEKTN